jgi:gamma-glutamyltranspeptidase/glutathione hydrolase
MNVHRTEGRQQPLADSKYATAEGGIVVTAFPLATQAGVKMLEMGGNAVDAACAAAFALGVCEPQSSGLGGQTMAMVHVNKRTFALDGSSRTPSLIHISKVINGDRVRGYQAATVPSTPAVLGYLHLRYGRLSWPTILEPAIRIARDGYRISPLQNDLQKRYLTSFFDIKSQSGSRYFLKNSKEPYEVGDLFVQPDLANVLGILADQGPRAFYLGKIAQQISEDMEANGGFLRADDLAMIPWPIERTPIKGFYRDFSVLTMPPPGAGRTLILVLLMLNHLQPAFLSKVSPKTCHFLAETFRKALLQRHQQPFDPNFYQQASDKTMINPVFAGELVKSIRDNIDPGLPLLESRNYGGETTHLSVMDKEGNAVGISQSIESIYGSKAVAEGLGFLYNNYILTMETKDPSHPYFLRPNTVPWSSVAPTIMFNSDKPWLVVGSPGSERIFSAVAQFVIHLVDGGLSMVEAMERPRLHCSLGGKVSLEADRFEPAIINHLERLGYEIDRRPPYSFYMGAIYAAMRCRDKKGFQGMAEIRREGSVAGPK